MKLKVLLIIVSRDMSDITHIPSMKKNIIDVLQAQGVEVDVGMVSSNNDHDNYKNILGNIKYKLNNPYPQLSKVCHIFTEIKYNDYDWYIKIRPEIEVLESIGIEKLSSCSKNAINARVRGYEGPRINVRYGAAVPNDYRHGDKLVHQKDYLHNENTIQINPDDQFYIFHKNIAKQAFSPLDITAMVNGEINVPAGKLYGKNVLKEAASGQREGFHYLVWTVMRKIPVNPRGI